MATQRIPIEQHIRTQRAWIKACGGSRAGYILRYGSARDEHHSGDGGEAIFAADQAELDRLLALQATGRKFL